MNGPAGLRNSRLQPLLDFGCAPALVELLDEAFPEIDLYAEQCGGQGLFCKVSRAADIAALCYVDGTRLTLAMDPGPARDLALLARAAVVNRKRSTWRVAITSAHALTAALRGRLIEDLQASYHREVRPGRASDAADDLTDYVAPTSPLRLCPLCAERIELPLNGVCDDHGKVL